MGGAWWQQKQREKLEQQRRRQESSRLHPAQPNKSVAISGRPTHVLNGRDWPLSEKTIPSSDLRRDSTNLKEEKGGCARILSLLIALIAMAACILGVISTLS